MDGGKQEAAVIDSFHVSGFVFYIAVAIIINIYLYV